MSVIIIRKLIDFNYDECTNFEYSFYRFYIRECNIYILNFLLYLYIFELDMIEIYRGMIYLTGYYITI